MTESANQNLIESATAGDLERVKASLTAGADVHAKEDYALRWAAGKGNREVAALLLERAGLWQAWILAEVEAGPCGIEVQAWRARRAVASSSASITEMPAP